MAETTTNYGLTKPLIEEFYDVRIQNGNMDIIDEELKKRATLGEDGKVPEEQLPDITNIPVTSETPADSDIWIDPDEDPYNVTIETIGAAPAYTYGTAELIAGESELATGIIYLMYE